MGTVIRPTFAGPETPPASPLKTELKYHLLCDSLGRAFKMIAFYCYKYRTCCLVQHVRHLLVTEEPEASETHQRRRRHMMRAE